MSERRQKAEAAIALRASAEAELRTIPGERAAIQAQAAEARHRFASQLSALDRREQAAHDKIDAANAAEKTIEMLDSIKLDPIDALAGRVAVLEKAKTK